MAIHLHRDLERLKREILLLGSMVETAVQQSILSLRDRRAELAQEVLRSDEQIDEREIRIEEECLKVLALHQPVANDLRFVITVMKVNNDLERVGDLAGNLAERAAFLAERDAVSIPDQLETMADSVPVLLRKALDAMIQLDTLLAREVLHDDEAVDEAHRQLYSVLQGRMRDDPDKIQEQMQLLSASRYLERMADLATNIAEDVVFLVDGDVVRHRLW